LEEGGPWAAAHLTLTGCSQLGKAQGSAGSACTECGVTRCTRSRQEGRKASNQGITGLPKVMLRCPPAKKCSASASVDTTMPAVGAACSCSAAIRKVLCLRVGHACNAALTANSSSNNARASADHLRLNVGAECDAGRRRALGHAAAITRHHWQTHEEARRGQLIEGGGSSAEAGGE
jgi:hypothetical protein